jgi:hypothetical protein
MMLAVVSAVATLLCVGVAVGAAVAGPRPVLWVAWLVLALPAACLPFVVRGYAVAGKVLVIRRLGWETRRPLAGLREAFHDPEALRGSIRLCGNGGLFSFTGWYWNRRIGHYRAFLNDPRRTVVLRFERRAVVVSPADPAAFLEELQPLLGGGAGGGGFTSPR